MEKSEYTEVIATRSGWAVGGTVALGVLLVFFAICCIILQEEPSAVYIFILCLLFGGFLVYYLCMVCILPEVMITYKGGQFHFYPRRGKEIVLPPEKVGCVQRIHFSGRRLSSEARPSGKLIVDLKGKPTVFRFVANLEYAEKRITEIKQERREELLRAELAEKEKTKE